MASSVPDRGDLDTWLALRLLREQRLPRETVRTLLTQVRSSRGQGGASLARSLVELGLFSGAELEALLPARTIAPPQSTPAPAGQRRLGEYELLERLGAGGMGTVYRARNLRSGAVHALKTLPANDPELVARFLREGEGQARAGDHPNVAKVHTLGSEQGVCYLAMDLIEGGTLADRLQNRLPELDQAAGWLIGLARAVEHAHRHQVLHRDLKPENVLFAGETPLLVDFGLAKLVDARSLTETGTILGTPAYMAPEQVDSSRGPMTEATDVYGLGALLYFCLAGRAPFAGGSTMNTLLQVLEQAPTPLSALRPDLPRALQEVCHRALAKDAALRYPSAAAFADALTDALQPTPPVGAKRAWIAVGLTGLGLSAALFASTWARPPAAPAGQASSSSPTSAPLPARPTPTSKTADPKPTVDYLAVDPVGSARVLRAKELLGPSSQTHPQQRERLRQQALTMLRGVLDRPRSSAHPPALFQLAGALRDQPNQCIPLLVQAALSGEPHAAAVLGLEAWPEPSFRSSKAWKLDLRQRAASLHIVVKDWQAFSIDCCVLGTLPRGSKPPNTHLLRSALAIVERHRRGGGRLPTRAEALERLRGSVTFYRFADQAPFPVTRARPSPRWLSKPTAEAKRAFYEAKSLHDRSKHWIDGDKAQDLLTRSLQRLRDTINFSPPSLIHGECHFLLARIHRRRNSGVDAIVTELARAALRSHWEAAAILGFWARDPKGRPEHVRSRWSSAPLPQSSVALSSSRTLNHVAAACFTLAIGEPKPDGSVGQRTPPPHRILKPLHGLLARGQIALMPYADAYRLVWEAFPEARPFE